MLTYSNLYSIIESIWTLIKKNENEEAVKKVIYLKQTFIEFLENFCQILDDVENKKISFAVYKILFQVISELALDLDVLYSDVIENDLPRKSWLSLILEKLGLRKEIEWFNLANDIMFEVMNFLSDHYEGSSGDKHYSLSREEIKKKIEKLKY